MRLAGECPVKHILDGYFRSSTDIKMRNCIHLTTQLHNNCTLNCMTCTPLRLGVQARPVSNASCYSYGLTGKFRPSRDNQQFQRYGCSNLESCRSTFEVRGRRSGEAAKGTHKRSWLAVPLDGIVGRFFHRVP